MCSKEHLESVAGLARDGRFSELPNPLVVAEAEVIARRSRTTITRASSRPFRRATSGTSTVTACSHTRASSRARRMRPIRTALEAARRAANADVPGMTGRQMGEEIDRLTARLAAKGYRQPYRAWARGRIEAMGREIARRKRGGGGSVERGH